MKPWRENFWAISLVAYCMGSGMVCLLLVIAGGIHAAVGMEMKIDFPWLVLSIVSLAVAFYWRVKEWY